MITRNLTIPELCGPVPPAPTAVTGIDLGMKMAVTCCEGSKLEGWIDRKHEAALGIAQPIEGALL